MSKERIDVLIRNETTLSFTDSDILRSIIPGTKYKAEESTVGEGTRRKGALPKVTSCRKSSYE